MALQLHPSTHPSQLWPLEKPLPEQFVAGTTFAELQQNELAGLSDLSLLENAWISADDAHELIEAEENAAIIDDLGNRLAWKGTGEGIILRVHGSFIVRFAWDLIAVNEQIVGKLSESNIQGDVHSAAHVEGQITVGNGTRILPGVFIEGNAIIGENCKIGPNCYIRGNTSIGDDCHIGQAVEIKNSIIGHKTAVGHLSYIGDSVLASGVNFGAGTITSNLRHDGKNHKSAVDGTLIDTGRRKFGAIIGPNVHTGINTSIYPGRKIGPGRTTKPGEVIAKDSSFNS